MTLSQAENRRYSRHLILPEVGLAGQEKLKGSSVLLIGAGGLGSPLALYLAAAGVGRIGIVDFDVVDDSNLQRQVLYGVSDIGTKKLEAARKRLLDLNPHIQVNIHDCQLSSENALGLFRQYDAVADGTDNFATRYLVNDACVLTGKPNIYGSIFRFEGQISVFHYQGGPCYRCLYSEPPPAGLVPSCAEGGVLGVLPGVVGTLQATEVVKVLLGIGSVASGRLIIYDALKMKFRELKLRRDPNCVICGDNPSVRALIDYDAFCGIPTKDDSLILEISVHDLKQKIDAQEEFILLDVREPQEYELCKIPGSTLIPLGRLEVAIPTIEKGKEIIVHCKTGGRSAKAVELLKKSGFSNVWNLKGGIRNWAEEIDPEMAIY